MHNPSEIKGFYPKSCQLRPSSNLFRNVMQQPGTDLTYGTVRSGKIFFGFHLYLAGKYCKKLKVPGAQLNVNRARAITLLVGVTVYCTFCNNNSPPPRQFLCNKIL